MAKNYLDTTLLVDAICGQEAVKSATVAWLKQATDSSIPYYALKEFRQGIIANWAYAHNALIDETSFVAALQKLRQIAFFQPRKGSSGDGLLLEALNLFLSAPAPSVTALTLNPLLVRQARESIAVKIFDAWERRGDIATLVHPLRCYADEDIEMLDGRIVGPKKKWACENSGECGAALHLRAEQTEVEKLLAVLRPPKKGTEKKETSRRRAALKAVVSKEKFPVKKCRALGDAYFVIKALPQHRIATTNLDDFLPLAEALKKTVVSPS